MAAIVASNAVNPCKRQRTSPPVQLEVNTDEVAGVTTGVTLREMLGLPGHGWIDLCRNCSFKTSGSIDIQGVEIPMCKRCRKWLVANLSHPQSTSDFGCLLERLEAKHEQINKLMSSAVVSNGKTLQAVVQP